MMDSGGGKAARGALPCPLDAWDVEVGQKIIDPLEVGPGDKSCYISVIEPSQFILVAKDK